MATVAQLNVEIGTRIKGLQQGLREATRDLKRFSADVKSMGNSLSMAFTLPMLGIGAAAVKAAGDMEALQLAMRATFEGAGRSAADADKELQALRESAKAPGLEFEQAVKGSVRLQNVGFSAEKARMIIEQLANTVATTGGTADDLGEVVNQFSQMIGKGKIFQDDLKIITGRMPKIAQLMKEAFGTTTAEGLNKLGVDARTFVDVITKKMQEMPRVQGGIANSIVNAWSAAKLGLAKVGEAINKTFNVSGRLDQFATWIVSLADGFAGLSDTMKAVILGAAAFLAAIGPMIRLVGLLGSGVLAAVKAFKGIEIAFTTIKAAGIIEWWKTLNTVMKANIIGATIAVVLALAAAFALLSKDMSAQAQAARAVEHVNQQAANAVQMEVTNAGLLVDVLKDENASREDKKRALTALNAISPKYFGNLDLEKSKVKDLDAAMQSYTDSLLRTAKARAALDQITELQKQLNAIELRRGNLSTGELQAMSLVGINNTTDALARQKKVLDEQAAPINAQIKALTDLAKQNSDLTALIGENTTITGKQAAGMGELSAQAKKVAEVMSDWKNALSLTKVLGPEAFDQQAEAVEGTIKKLIDLGLSPLSSEIQKVKQEARDLFGIGSKSPDVPTIPTLATPGAVQSENPIPQLPENITKGTDALNGFKTVSQQIGEILRGLNEQTATFGQTFAATAELINSRGTLMQQAILAAGGAMSEAAASGESSMGKLALAAVAAAAKVVRAWITQGVAAAVAKALSGIPFPFNIAAGAAAGGLAAGLFNKLLSGLKIPALAEGGLAAGPTMAMVGEYPGASSNPEVIAPLSKLRGMLEGNRATQLEGSFELRGSNLLLSLRAAARDYYRTTGKNPFAI